MASMDHLLIEGIPGESKDVGHDNELDILSYSFGLSNPSSPLGGGLGTGKATPGDFSFVIMRGKSHPKLIEALNKGTHIPTMTLKCSKTTGADNPEVYETFTFSDVMVNGYSVSSGGDGNAMENITTSFAELKIEYKEQKTDGGTLEVAATTGWNYKENQFK